MVEQRLLLGGKQINAGTLRSIFSFQTDKRCCYTVATTMFTDRKVNISQVASSAMHLKPKGGGGGVASLLSSN